MISFDVNDMTCGHCAGIITKALKAADQDAVVQIDLATHRVHVKPVTADAGTLAEAIQEAGYTPVRVADAEPRASSPAVGSCCGC